MDDPSNAKVQFNCRLPAATLREIAGAATEERKPVADYVRIAALTATCHTRRGSQTTVFLEPREGLPLERVRALGMKPVADLGSPWSGEVRVPLGKNGLFHDAEGGVWLLTPQGLKQVMGFKRSEPPRGQVPVHRRRHESLVP